ncbi:transposase [Acetobacteraceae bacterium]|nr:transposase [Candidatus Parcubacteria bacterium]
MAGLSIFDGNQIPIIGYVMRVEAHTVGSIMHVIKRGTRGVKIVKDAEDYTNFIRALFYLNDTYTNENWKRDTAAFSMFERPPLWPEREPLVNILAWTLLPNHFHLIIQERVEGGIAKFMQRLCNSMTTNFNKKYHEKGSLFQGSYKGRTVGKDTYLRQLVWYVMVKNVLELYPGGITAAVKNFNRAWEWGLQYKYSNFGTAIQGKMSPLIEDKERLIKTICQSPAFKKDSKETLKLLHFRSEELKSLALEEW